MTIIYVIGPTERSDLIVSALSPPPPLSPVPEAAKHWSGSSGRARPYRRNAAAWQEMGAKIADHIPDVADSAVAALTDTHLTLERLPARLYSDNFFMAPIIDGETLQFEEADGYDVEEPSLVAELMRQVRERGANSDPDSGS